MLSIEAYFIYYRLVPHFQNLGQNLYIQLLELLPALWEEPYLSKGLIRIMIVRGACTPSH